MKRLYLPENKFARLVVNVLFISVYVPGIVYLAPGFENLLEDIFGEQPLLFSYYLPLLAPIFFYTRYLWFEKSRKKIFFGLFDKLKILLKHLFKQFKINFKEFNTEVFNMTSSADELKKYAELKDPQECSHNNMS